MSSRSSYWSSIGTRQLSRRRLLKGSAVASVGLAGVGLVGCGDDDDDDEPTATATSAGGQTPAATPTQAAAQPKPGGTWRERSIAAPSAWEPYRNLSYSAQQHWGYITNRILRFSYGPEYLPNDLTLEPDLASAMPEQPDELTIVIPVREGVKFHNVPPVNGRAMTAEDVRWSLQRYKDWGQQKTAYNAIETIEATDDKTVTLKLNKKSAGLLNFLGDDKLMWLLAKEAATDQEMSATSPFVGTGPFIFEKYTTEVQMDFVKNPDYWEGEGKPYIERAEIAIIPQEPTADAQFRSGDLTLITVAEKERYDQLKAADTEELSYPSTGMAMKEFALHVPPFDNQLVRQALALAVNRDDHPAARGSIGYNLHTHAFNGGYTPYYLDPRGPDFGEEAKWFTYNATEAKKMLAAAGFNDANPLEFTHIYTPEYAGEQIQAELLVDQFADIGVKMNLKQYPYTEYQQRFKVADGAEWRSWEGMIGNRPATQSDPSLYFTTYWLGESTRCMQKFEDPELTAMFNDQDGELDSEARIEKLNDMQRYMAVQSRAITLHTENSVSLWRNTLKNMYPRLRYGRGYEMIAQVWFDNA